MSERIGRAAEPHVARRANVGLRLADVADRWPDAVAVAVPGPRGAGGRRQYRSVTFRELHDDSDRLAAGLVRMGIPRGARVVLLVRPGIDFISLVFAMFKAGLVTVLVDPGMGRRNLVRCLEEVEPEGFVAIPLAHAIRVLLGRRFPRSKYHVTVGRRWFWGGPTIDGLRAAPAGDFRTADTGPDDPAAIIFTTGSTGPPKGVLYRHGNFDRQVDELRDVYGIQPGDVDLPGFPLFALFNSALGVTTVVPDMDPTRPARVDPRKVVEAVRDWQINQAFGSPAMWNTVARHCEATGERLGTLRRVLSAGAPVPEHVLRRMQAAIADDGDIHTPYGATEALPVASISAREVLEETAPLTRAGAGTCVGRRFPGIQWKVIAIDDGPISHMDRAVELPAGRIGELIVRGPVVTSHYVTRIEANELHKISDGDSFWHRMGDVGYLDADDRFWYCGRKAQRVTTVDGTLFTEPCEAVFNQHPHVYRSALVGIGPRPEQRPVVVVEPWPEHRPKGRRAQQRLVEELRRLAAGHDRTRSIQLFLLRVSLPVDIRHNAKIGREQLAVWAKARLRRATR